jgi:hypothetical protein
MDQIFIEGALKNAQFFMPFFLLAYFLTLSLTKIFWIKFIPLFLYLFLSLADAFCISVKNKKNLVFILPFFYFLMHMSYAAGMFFTVFKKVLRSGFDLEKKDNIEIIRLREMYA